MKAMLSQPMWDKSDVEIVMTRDRAIKFLENAGFEVVNTLFTDDWYSDEQMRNRGVVQIPACFLAKSIENMSKIILDLCEREVLKEMLKMFKWGVTMPITNYIMDKSGRKYEFGIRNADSQSSEVTKAADALNDAYRRYNHAEGYNNVKAAIKEEV